MATYVWFRDGEYEYTNNLDINNPEKGGTYLAVRVADEIRRTVETVSNIPSTVTYNGVTYTVKYLYGCFPTGKPYGTSTTGYGGSNEGTFYDCYELKQLPTLPNTIDYTTLDSLYKYCYVLTSALTLPEGVVSMRYTYERCREMETVPPIPSTVTRMDDCFWNCYKLQTSPTLPPAVTNLCYTFCNCTSLTSAPEIPATATNMDHTFYGCENLSGNIVVNNTPTIYSLLFRNTVNDIYIVNGGTAGSVWKDTIAPSYSNVHYEADDHPAPSLSSLTAIRVASNGSTTPAERGLWAYLTAQVGISTDLLPVGWTSEYSSTSVEMDGTTITPTWTASASTGTITLTAWVNINDLSAHTFAVSVTEDIKEGATTKGTAISATLSTTLPKSYALVDYYHDPVTGTEGMAIGKYAEHADLLDIAVPSLFEDTLTAQDMTSQEIDDFVDSIGGGGDPIADVVVEVGTDGIWNYRKWESGKYEAWAFSTTTATHYVTFAGWYGYYVDLTLPSFMLTKDNLFITCPLASGTQFCMPTGYVISSSGLRAYCCSAGSGTQTIMFNLLMIGKWK